MQDVVFKEAVIEDIPLIAAMAEKIWRQHYITVISPEQIDYMLQKFYSSEALKEQMKNAQRFFIAYSGTTPAGYLSVTEKYEQDIFLNKLYIDPAFQRSRLGTAFFSFILKTFNPSSITLTVNRKNFKAINFYFKTGFRIEKVEDFDIGNNFLMEDFVMKWNKPAR